jgi:hypothetical protein
MNHKFIIDTICTFIHFCMGVGWGYYVFRYLPWRKRLLVICKQYNLKSHWWLSNKRLQNKISDKLIHHLPGDAIIISQIEAANGSRNY